MQSGASAGTHGTRGAAREGGASVAEARGHARARVAKSSTCGHTGHADIEAKDAIASTNRVAAPPRSSTGALATGRPLATCDAPIELVLRKLSLHGICASPVTSASHSGTDGLPPEGTPRARCPSRRRGCATRRPGGTGGCEHGTENQRFDCPPAPGAHTGRCAAPGGAAGAAVGSSPLPCPRQGTRLQSGT